jgi:hypothetical protein
MDIIRLCNLLDLQINGGSNEIRLLKLGTMGRWANSRRINCHGFMDCGYVHVLSKITKTKEKHGKENLITFNSRKHR